MFNYLIKNLYIYYNFLLNYLYSIGPDALLRPAVAERSNSNNFKIEYSKIYKAIYKQNKSVGFNLRRLSVALGACKYNNSFF